MNFSVIIERLEKWHNLFPNIVEKILNVRQSTSIQNKDKFPMLKGANEYTEDGFARLFFYYNRWGLTGNNNILRFLLQREPTSVEDYVIKSLES